MDDRRLVTTSDEAGEYTLAWPWHEYYNRFRLVVGVPVKEAGGEDQLRIVEQIDLTTRIEQGTPVVVSMVIDDSGFIASVRDFAAAVHTEDESRIYDQMGRPDRVETIDHADYQETSWWYFASGRAIAFATESSRTSLTSSPSSPSTRPSPGARLNPKTPLLARTEETEAPPASRFLELIADKLAQTELVFRGHLQSEVPFIQHAGEYISSGGGKRMRPAMLLLAAKLLDRDSDEEVTYAAVVELIHTATLIHDDIIDHASLRRGQATVNQVWGNSLTVLLGDWHYTTAMQMALRHDNLEVIRRLCEATLRMTEGELLALQRLGAVDLTVEEYFDIVRRKTAQLFAVACSIPSLMLPARPAAGAALTRYGLALGTCFQLVDDLLDFTARESEVGKPVLSDLKEGKLTLPLIALLPRVDAGRRGLIEQVLEDGGFGRVAAEQILELVTTEGTLDEVAEMAESYAEAARRELAFFPAGAAREALEFAPDFVLQRRF